MNEFHTMVAAAEELHKSAVAFRDDETSHHQVDERFTHAMRNMIVTLSNYNFGDTREILPLIYDELQRADAT